MAVLLCIIGQAKSQIVSPTAGPQGAYVKQLNEGLRTKTDKLPLTRVLKPFYHAMASGDPLSDWVVIWTKVTPEGEGEVDVTWVVTTDASLENEARRGTFTTNAPISMIFPRSDFLRLGRSCWMILIGPQQVDV